MAPNFILENTVSTKKFTGDEIEINRINHFFENSEKTVKAVAKVGVASTQVVFSVAMIINLPLAVYLMKLFQTISYLNLINIPIPSNL